MIVLGVEQGMAMLQIHFLLPCWPVAATSPSLLTVLCSCLIMGLRISYDLLLLRVYFMGLYWQVKLYFAYGLQIIFFLRLPAISVVLFTTTYWQM